MRGFFVSTILIRSGKGKQMVVLYLGFLSLIFILILSGIIIDVQTERKRMLVIKVVQRGPITITTTAEQDNTPVRGNYICSDDEAFDRKAEDDVIEQLNGGNELAWCAVSVEAQIGQFKQAEHLGGCSYEHVEKAADLGGYYTQMEAEAIAGLKRNITEAKEAAIKAEQELTAANV